MQLGSFAGVWSLLAFVVCLAPIVAQDTPDSLDDLFDKYGEIFPSGNRNAASHRWASYILERSQTMSDATLVKLFGGFCAVSGSPVRPSSSIRWRYTLPLVGGGAASGSLHHCCWPCVCDTQDFIQVDTKSVSTLDGEKQYKFAVHGNPCAQPERIPAEAPDVSCADGLLEKAVRSDRGYVIVGMLFEDDGDSMDTAAVQRQCAARAEAEYNSGMGQIFRQVAGINPIRDGNVSHGQEDQIAPAGAQRADSSSMLQIRPRVVCGAFLLMLLPVVF